jgi:hypothetical protein
MFIDLENRTIPDDPPAPHPVPKGPYPKMGKQVLDKPRSRWGLSELTIAFCVYGNSQRVLFLRTRGWDKPTSDSFRDTPPQFDHPSLSSIIAESLLDHRPRSALICVPLLSFIDVQQGDCRPLRGGALEARLWLRVVAGRSIWRIRRSQDRRCRFPSVRPSICTYCRIC